MRAFRIFVVFCMFLPTITFSEDVFTKTVITDDLTVNMQLIQSLLESKANCKVTIFSGKRTKEHNDRIHGAKESLHLTGNAIDFAFNCLSINDGAKIAAKFCRGLGIYPRHLHCDTRTGRKVVWHGTY